MEIIPNRKVCMVMAKTRITGIIDQSSFGLSSSTELEIDKTIARQLRKAVIGQTGHQWLRSSGEDTFYLNDVNGANYAVYQVKVSNNRLFLNVTGNPTRMLSGRNDFPVLLTGVSGNAALETFKFGLRLPYLILEKLPSSEPFVWPREYRKMIDAGNFSVTQLQLAWYSADLGESRDTVLKYLRSVYAGGVGHSTKTLASLINITATKFDNGMDNYNLSLQSKVGKNKSFTLVLYAKDKSNLELNKEAEEEDDIRVNSRIRFDCTLFGTYLRQINAGKVNDLERLFQLKCEEDSYDIGFYKWLTNRIYNRLKLNVMLTLNSDTFFPTLASIREYVAENLTGGKKEVKAKMLQAWLTKSFSTGEEWANEAGVSHISVKRSQSILEEEYGMDFMVPYELYLHSISNLANLCMTNADVERLMDYGSNSLPDFDAIRRKVKAITKEVAEKLSNGKGFRLAKMKPTRVRVDNYHLLKLINASPRPKQDTAKKHKFEM